MTTKAELIQARETCSGLERTASIGENKTWKERLSDFYFTPREFEKSGRLYECLGIKYFKKVLMRTQGQIHKRQYGNKTPDNYFIGEKPTLEALKTFESEARGNEGVHLIAGVLASMCGTALAYAHDLDKTAVFFGANALFNLPLIMLQRYNRARVVKAIERKEKKSGEENE
jgi:hypothetical protein